jgi:hypothetical protein
MKKTEGRGGKRAGAGRKPRTRVYSDDIKDELIVKLRDMGTQLNTSWLEQLAKLAIGGGYGNNSNAQLGAMKLVAEILVVKESVKVVETLPGVVELPSRVEDPVEEAKATIQ